MVAPIEAAVRYEDADAASSFACEVIAGLTTRPKRLSPKYFYDETGAQLFEQITALPEYYLTRCELEILREQAREIAQFFPAPSALVEFGSGSSKKMRILLAAAPTIAAYVPVDISSQMLTQEAQELRRDHPRLAVLPVEADFTKPFALPAAAAGMAHTGFFPGSTIGNFEMHLVSKTRQHVRVAGREFDFAAGESIHTENSYKYTLEHFRTLARGAGWTPVAVWTDSDKNFSVHALAFQD